MSRPDEQRVQDILDAADQVVDIAQVGRDAWDKDRLRQLATERLLEIIGESANTLTDEFRASIRKCHGVTSSACASFSRTTTIASTLTRHGSSRLARYLDWPRS